MKLAVSFLLWLVLGLTHYAASEEFQCLRQSSDADIVALLLYFQFASTDARHDWIYHSLTPTLQISGAPSAEKTRPTISRIKDGQLEALFCLRFPFPPRRPLIVEVAPGQYRIETPPRVTPPRPGQSFIVDVGPRQYKIAERQINWLEKKFTNKDGVHLTEGVMPAIVLLEQPDPDWPILQSARLLSSVEGNIHLVEIIVDNRSRHSIPVNAVGFEVFHPTPHPLSGCFIPDPFQLVTLSWGTVISTQARHGIWTTLANTDVAVQAEYKTQGECGPYHFKATIPIQQTVPGNQVSRVILRLKELPDIKIPDIKNRKRIKPPLRSTLPKSPLPPSFLDWARFEVTLHSNPAVFPKGIILKR